MLGWDGWKMLLDQRILPLIFEPELKTVWQMLTSSGPALNRDKD